MDGLACCGLEHGTPFSPSRSARRGRAGGLRLSSNLARPNSRDTTTSTTGGSWEYLIYLLAGDAGIGMPPAKRVLLSDRYHTYCVSQFDRQAGAAGAAQGRRMYASAMTLLERRDGQEGGSYLHLIEALESCGGVGLTDDMHQLF